MSQRPAADGRRWFKEGFAMFRKQPGELSTIVLAYFFSLSVVTLLLGPQISAVVAGLLTPVMSVAFMRASAHVASGRRAMPSLLLSGFRKPAVRPLLAIGLLQVAGLALAVWLRDMIDNGVYEKVLLGQLPKEAIADSNFAYAMLAVSALSVPIAMALCFSPALVYWQRQSVGKALFFSFFAVLRSLKAFSMFVLYASVWVILPSMVMLALFGATPLTKILLTPLTLLMLIVVQCGLYASYRDIFGTPEGESEPVAPAR